MDSLGSPSIFLSLLRHACHACTRLSRRRIHHTGNLFRLVSLVFALSICCPSLASGRKWLPGPVGTSPFLGSFPNQNRLWNHALHAEGGQTEALLWAHSLVSPSGRGETIFWPRVHCLDTRAAAVERHGSLGSVEKPGEALAPPGGARVFSSACKEEGHSHKVIRAHANCSARFTSYRKLGRELHSSLRPRGPLAIDAHSSRPSAFPSSSSFASLACTLSLSRPLWPTTSTALACKGPLLRQVGKSVRCCGFLFSGDCSRPSRVLSFLSSRWFVSQFSRPRVSFSASSSRDWSASQACVRGFEFSLTCPGKRPYENAAFQTQLWMTRSRSKPKYRAAHPGLKQMILREKFWTRFDPNRNKLVHTPEYQELLVSERRRALQREVEDLSSRGEGQEDAKGDAGVNRTSEQAFLIRTCLTEPEEENVELSDEQKREVHRREVRYLQQQPKFRQKQWGSGRFKKEEGYLFRLLESHRQKLREHDVKRRQRQLAAQRLAELSQALAADEDKTTGGDRDTDEILQVEDERIRRRIREANKELSYSFVITQVVPYLARLEQQTVKDSVAAWHQRMDKSLCPGEEEETNSFEAGPASLLHQVQRLHQKKNLHKGPQQVLSVYEQQQMFLGNVGFLDPVAERKRRSGCGRNREDERFLGRLRIAAARTRSIYLQFLVDLHFIFTSFEEFLTDGLEALLNDPRSSKEDQRGFADEETGVTDENKRPGEVQTNSRQSEEESAGNMESRGASREDTGNSRSPERWRNREHLEEFVSTLSFQKGFRSADDVFSICHLIKRNPPAPSAEAQVFILRLADLMHKDFIRALARIYHFHKEWSVAGRFFLAAVTTRQQLLPKKLKLTMWDADTDSLELAIDVVSLSWTPAEKEAFLEELQFAAADAQAAVAQPLLEGIKAGLHAVMHDGSNVKKRRKRQQAEEGDIEDRAEGNQPEREPTDQITQGESDGSPNDT
ncbi:hypothetical protein TGMAS_259190 [Toxoplasma gondii MAS]|uniref:Uncharacterized protein n=2 Tax=Toxoplasma gondii TaxID=5811 RepID=A0A086PSM1_TOXGO|nr:hypothetical protein TGMAS_259190 [Toxoplasma gondii MAS]